jgi:hypothetical protein
MNLSAQRDSGHDERRLGGVRTLEYAADVLEKMLT